MNPWELLTGKAEELFKGIEGIIDQVDTDRQEELKARNELAKLEKDFYTTMTDARTEIVKQQSKTIRAEIHSDHWLASNWRPILMLTFGFIAVYSAVAPALGAPGLAMEQVPSEAWQVMMIGIGGYVAGRSAEKIIPNSKWGPKQSGESNG